MSRKRKKVCIRWTVGDVSPAGFRALQLSVWGAYRIFGSEAEYVICVNSTPLSDARMKTGVVPREVNWRAVTMADVPVFLLDHLEPSMAEGVAWKFAPLRLFPDRHELSLENGCILWNLPNAIQDWLSVNDGQLLADDVRRCVGQFSDFCRPEARNTGIRGLPPRYDLGAALKNTLLECPVTLQSETDEQGLQVLTLSHCRQKYAVSVEDVTICSPFSPHLPYLGRCGAHFVGLNAKHLPWTINGVSLTEAIRDHWNDLAGEISKRVGLAGPTILDSARSGSIHVNASEFDGDPRNRETLHSDEHAAG